MQPQSPYGPQQPYNPQSPQGQPVGPVGQQYQPGQPYAGQPGQPIQQGQPYTPPMPVYTPPQGAGTAQQPDNLPPPPPAATTPYDFFMDQPKPHASANPLSPSGRRYGAGPLPEGSNKTTFIFLGAGALVVMLILAVGYALLPKDKTAPQWFAVAQQQQEVVRVCTLGSKAKYQTTRNFAITCQTGVTTSQRQLLAYMKKTNLSYDSKQLGLLADAKIDARLKSAASSSTYDDVFREIAEQQLTRYNSALTAQLAATTGVNGREVLSQNQQSLKLLLQMVQDDGDKTIAPETTDTTTP
jgi:hypothetical protein